MRSIRKDMRVPMNNNVHTRYFGRFGEFCELDGLSVRDSFFYYFYLVVPVISSAHLISLLFCIFGIYLDVSAMKTACILPLYIHLLRG